MHLPIDKWGTLWKPTLREKILTGNEMQYYKRTITIKVVNLITSTHIICFFVCTFFFCPIWEFFTHMKHSWPLSRRVPHLLWHRTSVYNGHLWWPVLLPPVAKHLAVELTTPVLTTSACHDQGSRPDLPHARQKLYLWDTQPGIKARSPTCKAKALPMRHHDQGSKPDLPHARQKLYLWYTEAVLHNVYNLSSSILNFGWIITVKPI